jgi:hypothetical protein
MDEFTSFDFIRAYPRHPRFRSSFFRISRIDNSRGTPMESVSEKSTNLSYSPLIRLAFISVD